MCGLHKRYRLSLLPKARVFASITCSANTRQGYEQHSMIAGYLGPGYSQLPGCPLFHPVSPGMTTGFPRKSRPLGCIRCISIVASSIVARVVNEYLVSLCNTNVIRSGSVVEELDQPEIFRPKRASPFIARVTAGCGDGNFDIGGLSVCLTVPLYPIRRSNERTNTHQPVSTPQKLLTGVPGKRYL